MADTANGRHAERMFLLFFGYGTKVKARGVTDERRCPRCHNTTRWQHIERYRYLSLFFVRLARWKHENLDVCPVCGQTETPAPAARRPTLHLIEA